MFLYKKLDSDKRFFGLRAISKEQEETGRLVRIDKQEYEQLESQLMVAEKDAERQQSIERDGILKELSDKTGIEIGRLKKI
ncbi:hypothetical protein LCGC14_0458910 [marine sediment metagenome]|uniref:Uncharacterized protein n=1 Tax=marine sediment metagenome TaxID=412755 RepID=A0A0F9VPM6_9ZZZZ